MAQANSVQREPSMEEILASIRRIIEDSDTMRKPADGAVVKEMPKREPEFERPEFERQEAGRPAASVLEVDAFRTELRAVPMAANAAEPVAAPVPEKKPVTLADVQAGIARELAALPPEPVVAAPVEEAKIHQAPPQEESDEFYVEVELDRPAESRFEPAPREAEISAPQAPMVQEIEHEQPSPKPAIISEHAGRQVAAAFGELSEAFAASRKKSFDELAEEMMRPMLQDWLDNNLPVLVERLVREEIERVARGVQ